VGSKLTGAVNWRCCLANGIVQGHPGAVSTVGEMRSQTSSPIIVTVDFPSRAENIPERARELLARRKPKL
jgi:hypothetical protein